MLAGVGLDMLLYPGSVGALVSIRIVVDLILAGLVWGVLKLGRRLGTQFVSVVGLLGTLVVSGSFSLMIGLTDGAESPYFVAIVLILMSMTIMLPWVIWEAAVAGTLSLIFYVMACLLASGEAESSPFLVWYHVMFLGITVGVCLVITHFLARSRYEEFRLRFQLDEQNKKLQDLDRLKTQFFSNVSHELRTPLTLILGPTEELLSRGDLIESKVHDSLILVHRNTLRLLKLINELLDLTRLDHGVELVRLRSVDLCELIPGVVESIRHVALSKSIRVRIEGSREPLLARIDPARMEKVLLNLLTNAIKYTPAGGQVTVDWGFTTNEVWFEVRDTGVGIPQEDLPKVFDRFHQVRSNTTNQSQGVGIGLALAREIVRQHGGDIIVASRVGLGTTFRVNLPQSRQETVAADVGDQPVDNAEAELAEEPFARAFRAADRSWAFGDAGMEEFPTVGGGSEVVLVADDEPDMRRYVISLLAPEYRVVQTADGVQVSDLVKEHNPSLILLDWMMPGKDGLTVCRELREGESNADRKIIVVTARTDEKSPIMALEAGADDFLTKPFSSIELQTRVRGLLRTSRLQRDLRDRNVELTEAMLRLAEAEGMLIQSEKMSALGSMAAGLLHEINNPLNYTLTAIGFAKQLRGSLDDTVAEIVDDIAEGMERIRDVITELRTFAYPERPGARICFSIADPIKSAIKILSRDLEGIELTVDVDDALVVKGQRTQLIHVFLNLLNNAARAINEAGDGRKRWISIRGDSADGFAQIRVSDSGPGVPPAIRNRIFDAFFTTREVGSGMGMGLSICHTIIRAHEGTIDVGEAAEGGAEFLIQLPTSQEELVPC